MAGPKEVREGVKVKQRSVTEMLRHMIIKSGSFITFICKLTKNYTKFHKSCKTQKKINALRSDRLSTT